MSRKTYRWIDGVMTLVAIDGRALYREPRQAPDIIPDLPGYESPVTGKWVEGRKARREDLKRSNARPWEGLTQERQEATKVQAENERRLDQLAEKMAYRMWDQAPESARRLFRSK